MTSGWMKYAFWCLSSGVCCSYGPLGCSLWLSCVSGQDQSELVLNGQAASGCWSFHLLQQNPLPPFISLFFPLRGLNRIFSSFFSARKTQHIFPLLTQTSLSRHTAFFISVLNTQRKQTHTPGGVQTMRKSVPWLKDCNDRMFVQSSDKTVDADCSLTQLPKSVLPEAPLIYNQQTRRVYLLCISGSQLLCLHSLHSALSPNNNEWALSRLQRACAFVWRKHY